ncbi:hypothetical protein TNCV_1483901 [Trichonephila clavipes]|nr:hypothetical protein TNCV_1483901 [Trichonephila clavipes]
MVEVKPKNISLNQLSPGLCVRTAISPTLTEEIIIHPSVYAEIKKLGHAKSDVLLSESGSSLSADSGVVSFQMFLFSNVIENSSYDLPHVKNFNTRNDLSFLIKDYRYSPLVSMKKEKRGRTAADSGQSGWPIVAAKAKQSSRAGAANENRNCKTLRLLIKSKSEGETQRCASRRYLLHIIVKLIYLLINFY